MVSSPLEQACHHTRPPWDESTKFGAFHWRFWKYWLWHLLCRPLDCWPLASRIDQSNGKSFTPPFSHVSSGVISGLKWSSFSLRQSSSSGHLGIRLFPRPPWHAPCRLNPPLLPGWHSEILWLLCLQRMAKFSGHLDHTTLLCPLLGWPRLLQDHKVIHDWPLFYIHWKQHTEPLLLSTAPSSLSAWNQVHHGAHISSAPPCNHVPSSAD